MFGLRTALLLLVAINVLVNGYQDDGYLDGELEVLLKRLLEGLEEEERGYELKNLFERESMSGIEFDEEVSTIFNDMKLRKTLKWITFKIENKKKIIKDQSAEPNDNYGDKTQFDEMKAKLTSEPRYILYDFKFDSKEGRKINKIAFIFWCDDNAIIGDKMIYASSKDAIKKAFTGLGLEFQANTMAQLDYETFRAEVEKKA
ncbi:cofilin-like [Patiria miniata]|uniref:ADF-H domain-containing protein n=1 Tax=Patiria miniata TaxID=46514 RepID=A0A913ZIS2_PATMI|nr:cofilin-like [Patiria miniata]XP_038050947.1 cofilin-like [Patiria miniata]